MPKSTARTRALRGNGDGTFAAKVDYPTGDEPRSVAAADLDSRVTSASSSMAPRST